MTSENSGKVHPKESFEEVPLRKAVLTYIQYGIAIFWGYVNDWLRKIGLRTDVSLKDDVSSVV